MRLSETLFAGASYRSSRQQIPLISPANSTAVRTSREFLKMQMLGNVKTSMSVDRFTIVHLQMNGSNPPLSEPNGKIPPCWIRAWNAARQMNAGHRLSNQKEHVLAKECSEHLIWEPSFAVMENGRKENCAMTGRAMPAIVLEILTVS